MREDLVYLVQTDTTVGFLSKSFDALVKAKKRPPQKPFLVATDSLAEAKWIARVPKKHRSFVRRSYAKSFVFTNGKSFRAIKGSHRDFVQKFSKVYTTSANLHKESFDVEYAKKASDVIVETKSGLYEATPSQIWYLAKNRRVRLR